MQKHSLLDPLAPLKVEKETTFERKGQLSEIQRVCFGNKDPFLLCDNASVFCLPVVFLTGCYTSKGTKTHYVFVSDERKISS